MARITEIRFDATGLQFLLNDVNGPVGQDLERRTARVVAKAKHYAEGNPIDTAVAPSEQHGLFGGGIATRGAGGRFERSRVSESLRSVNQGGRGPRVKTGRLHESINGRVERAANGELVGQVGTDVPYSFYLETGVRGGGTFPFLTPALAAAGD